MLIFDASAVTEYLLQRQPGLQLRAGAVAIGWECDGQLTAGAVFEGFNGRTVWAHVAIDRHLPRQFLRAFLAYPFSVCGVDVLRGVVDASNVRIQTLAHRLGARVEARLQGAAADGGDVLIYALHGQKVAHEPLAQT